MLSHDEVRSGNLLIDLLEEERVSCSFLGPSFMRTLHADLLKRLPWPVLRIVFCGGEARASGGMCAALPCVHD